MRWTLCALSIFCGLAALPAVAQTVIEGVLYGREPDGNERPLAGARLQWKGTTVGALTAQDGRFRLARPHGADTLHISALGYKDVDTVLPRHFQGELRLVLEAGRELPRIAVESSAPTISAAPVKTEHITLRQLEQSACCTLAESFEKSPTVEATFSDPLIGARHIQMLGLSGAYVQTLVEAVPAFRGLSLPFQWEYVPGPFLEGIAISKGAASVVDGYEGLTGSISIDYRKPYDGTAFFANLYGNSVGRFEANLISARALGQQWHGTGFLHGRWTGWERDVNGDGFIDMPLARQLNGMVRLLSAGKPELQLLVRGLVDERHGGTLRSVPPERAYSVDILGRRGEFIAKGTLELTEGAQLGLRLSVSGQQLQATLGQRRYDGVQQTGLLKVLFVGEESRVRVRAGADMLLDVYDERFADTAWKRQEMAPGLFAEMEYRPREELLLVAGLRGDWHSVAGAFLTPRAYLRWQPLLGVTARLSVGRGMRMPNPVADNLPFFLSSRQLVFGRLSPEWGWNYGGSVTVLAPVGGIWTIDLELYRTEFRNQVVPDLDSSARLLLVQDVGYARATSALVQLEGRLFGIEMRLAYRWWDVWARTGGQWRRRPLISPHRVLATLSYAPAHGRWQADATVLWNSSGRLPSTAENPDSLRWGEHFPAVVRLNGQLTYRLGAWDIYLGVENVTNALQRPAILDPQNPRSPYFDASLVWGPLEGRLLYVGVRWRVQ